MAWNFTVYNGHKNPPRDHYDILFQATFDPSDIKWVDGMVRLNQLKELQRTGYPSRYCGVLKHVRPVIQSLSQGDRVIQLSDGSEYPLTYSNLKHHTINSILLDSLADGAVVQIVIWDTL